MMRPRWRKVIHDLFDNKTRTFLVVVSIAIGVFSVGVIAGAYEIISNDMSTSYSMTNPKNIDLRTTEFSEDLIDMVENLQQVQSAEGRRIFNIRVRKPGSTSWTTLNLVAIKDFDKAAINQREIIQGNGNPDKKEILLDKKALENLPVQVGDTLELQLIDGTVKSMPVVGIVQDQATGAGDFLAPPLAFIKMETLTYLQQPDTYNRLLIVVHNGQNDETLIRDDATQIKDKIEKNDVSVIRMHITKTNEHPMAPTVQAILGILGALGILILFLSSSLIANTLSSLLSQHIRHIGVMKLVGARQNQVVILYITLIVGFSLLALAIAIPLGGQGAYGLAQFIADKLNFRLLGYRVVPFALLIQIVIGLAVPILVGLLPVLRGSQISVHRALSNDTIGDEIVKRKSKSFSLYDRIDHFFREQTSKRGIHFPRPLLISLRNTFRHRGRLVLTLFTLTMGGAIFIAVFNARVTLHDYIDKISNYFLADVSLDFEHPYRLNDIRNAAMKVPGVVNVEGWTFADAEAQYPDGSPADNISMLAPPEKSTLVDPILIQGRWLQPGDQKSIAISDDIWDKFPGLLPGQTIRLKVFGREDNWLVVGIFKFVSQEGTIGYSTYEYLSHLSNQSNQAFSYRVRSEKHDPASQKLLSDRLDQYFRDNGYNLQEAKTGTSTMKSASESLDILIAFLFIMAVLTASVGSIGLAGAMGMNVMERTREIGIMRSIGAVDKAIMEMVIIEGTVVGGLSWLLGALLSIPITYLLTTIVSVAVFNSPIDILFTWTGYALWLGLVLVLSAIASVIPARNAAKLTIREVLAYE